MRNVLYLILFFCLFPHYANAQAKPKRDISKDKSVIVAKKQKKTTKKRQLLQREKENIINRNTKQDIVNRKTKSSSFDAQTTSFLTVDKENISLSRILKPNKSEISFDVNTDRKNWFIKDLPSWCRVRKHLDFFILEYEANPLPDERRDKFVVKCNNNEVTVNLIQPGRPLNIRANISTCYLEHNFHHPTLGLCLKIKATVTITGAAGEKCSIDAYFIDETGRHVTASSGFTKYTLDTDSSTICIRTTVTPLTDTTHFYNVICYLPNNALNLHKKKSNLCCKLMLWNDKKGYLPDVKFTIDFKAKSKQGVVMTKSY